MKMTESIKDYLIKEIFDRWSKVYKKGKKSVSGKT